MIMRLNKDLQRKFVKVKRGEIFGQVVVLPQAVEKEISPLFVALQRMKIEHSIDFSFIPTEDFNLFYQTIHSCWEFQS